MTTDARRRRWILVAERGTLRLAMAALGFVLMVLGLGLGVTMVMLPAGIVIGLAGVGLLVWGTLGDMPLDTR